VEKAIIRLGERAVVTQDPREVEAADGLILPGDGAFHDAMRNLDTLNLIEPVKGALREGRPFLGICLGYQLLFSESEEFGQGKGLDILSGVVRRFPGGLKVPHMGWNQLEHRGDLPILEGIPSGAYFYFVHSYYPEPLDRAVAVATCTYGVSFAAAIAKGNLFGTQFHPEKSQKWGLKLLENFTRLVGRGRR
jgi:glutamine amidotransferase